MECWSAGNWGGSRQHWNLVNIATAALNLDFSLIMACFGLRSSSRFKIARFSGSCLSRKHLKWRRLWTHTIAKALYVINLRWWTTCPLATQELLILHLPFSKILLFLQYLALLLRVFPLRHQVFFPDHIHHLAHFMLSRGADFIELHLPLDNLIVCFPEFDLVSVILLIVSSFANSLLTLRARMLTSIWAQSGQRWGLLVFLNLRRFDWSLCV